MICLSFLLEITLVLIFKSDVSEFSETISAKMEKNNEACGEDSWSVVEVRKQKGSLPYLDILPKWWSKAVMLKTNSTMKFWRFSREKFGLFGNLSSVQKSTKVLSSVLVFRHKEKNSCTKLPQHR
jgi:hypothetical protein